MAGGGSAAGYCQCCWLLLRHGCSPAVRQWWRPAQNRCPSTDPRRAARPFGVNIFQQNEPRARRRGAFPSDSKTRRAESFQNLGMVHNEMKKARGRAGAARHEHSGGKRGWENEKKRRKKSERATRAVRGEMERVNNPLARRETERIVGPSLVAYSFREGGWAEGGRTMGKGHFRHREGRRAGPQGSAGVLGWGLWAPLGAFGHQSRTPLRPAAPPATGTR